MISNKNSYFAKACRCIQRLNLRWYHILITLHANSMITA